MPSWLDPEAVLHRLKFLNPSPEHLVHRPPQSVVAHAAKVCSGPLTAFTQRAKVRRGEALKERGREFAGAVADAGRINLPLDESAVLR